MATSFSGTGGGFYKYRCKYFYTKSCQNWVYVNGEACMQCLADGCDAHGHEDGDPGSHLAEACARFEQIERSEDTLSSRDGQNSGPNPWEFGVQRERKREEGGIP
ncbi:hypothetical protein jhhlp_001489 [Lomentospora prolificans]|uniref:Uncharacterized protein n=1 Tax=Lomentospora prolificans TaxID=41688 RepID=A0A2N3NID4_9PEZI|nr:hypothetical protein jhhlp_001489 [Lomentospora prolificans]